MSVTEIAPLIGEMVRKRRKELGLAPYQVATFAGVNPKTVESIERGDFGQWDKVAKVLDYLGIVLDPSYTSYLNKNALALEPAA